MSTCIEGHTLKKVSGQNYPMTKGQSEKKVKTTIDIPEQLWKDFSIKVIQKHGGRKKNDVIEELIKKYVREGENH